MNMFKEGDYVRVKYDLYKIEDFEGGYVSGMSEYSGKVYRIRRVSVRHSYLLEDVPYIWDERALEYPDNTKEDKKVDKIKNVSFDEVKLTRREFKDVVMEVATDFITNPPAELEGRTAFMLAMTVPIIGDKIANRLFGEEKKEEE